jgi:hypothetical protein
MVWLEIRASVDFTDARKEGIKVASAVSTSKAKDGPRFTMPRDQLSKTLQDENIASSSEPVCTNIRTNLLADIRLTHVVALRHKQPAEIRNPFYSYLLWPQLVSSSRRREMYFPFVAASRHEVSARNYVRRRFHLRRLPSSAGFRKGARMSVLFRFRLFCSLQTI